MNICRGIVTMAIASTAITPPPRLLSPSSSVHLPFPIPPLAVKKRGMVREGGRERERERWQDWTNKMH